MKRFEMVKYGRWQYPADVPVRIAEIAGHFDKSDIYPKQTYSLHTEYSFGSRNFSSRCLNGLDVIKRSNLYGIPQLWKNREWAHEFSRFITAICDAHSAPEVIEVHPPFVDYSEDMHHFIEVYKEFEYEILQKYPDVKICIPSMRATRITELTSSASSDIVSAICSNWNSILITIALAKSCTLSETVN